MFCEQRKAAIKMFTNNSMNHVWRKDAYYYSPKNTIPTVKFGGGNVMVWDIFSTDGTGNIQAIESRINVEKYHDILNFY